MKFDDKGFLLSKSRYSENSVIAEFYSQKHGKISGIIFGATSSKIKNFLLLGNHFSLQYNSKNQNKTGYFKIEIDKIFTPYSANLNSGYGAYSMLLSYPIKELAVFGMDFYNFGEYEKIEEKYNPEYIKQQGQDGTYLGPETMVHDIIGQVMHFKNIILKDPRFIYDKEPLEKINSEKINKRIEIFKNLPRLATHDIE